MPKISSGSRNCRHSSLSTHSAKPSFEINCLFFLVQTGQMRLLLLNVKKHFFKHIYTRLMEIFYSLANISCQSSFFSILVSTIFIAFIQNCNAFKIYSYFYPYAIFVNSVADQSPRQLSSNQNCRTLL